MKEKTKKHRAWFFVAIIVLLIYIVFALTRFSEHTLFIPFTGRVLNIDSGDLNSVYIQSGNTGERIVYTGAKELQVMTNKLNDFHYILWLPKNPIPTGGWTYRVVLGFEDGTTKSFYFGKAWIEVRGVRFFSAGNYFADMVGLLD